jgi:hypothetical protein
LPVIRSAVRTWTQTLHDLLDRSPLESRAVVVDESVTNLRELIDGVIALLTPSATRQGMRLRANVDQTVAETILADSGRLGQVFFHLLNRTIQLSTHREIVLVVRAEPLNSGSQRIFISVVETGEKNASAAQLQLFGPAADQPLAGKWLGYADACLPLCQLVAQRMRGELSVASGADAGARASFNAPFAIEQRQPSAGPARSGALLPLFASAAQAADASAGASSEPFERRCLDALSDEGIDIRSFLNGWHRAMEDDLERLSALRRDGDFDHLHTLLHRLSGAVGLVGARSLMEALQRASTSPLERNAGSIDVLTERTRTLITQLETAPGPHRSIL